MRSDLNKAKSITLRRLVLSTRICHRGLPASDRLLHLHWLIDLDRSGIFIVDAEYVGRSAAEVPCCRKRPLAFTLRSASPTDHLPLCQHI